MKFLTQMKLSVATEVKAGRSKPGNQLYYSILNSPYGLMLVATYEGQICHLSFDDEMTDSRVKVLLGEEWLGADIVRDDEAILKLARALFTPKISDSLQLKIFLKGTEMQLDVWKALLSIAAGEMSTYGEIAKAIGRPKAVRAVGTAIGRNPISYLVPCHRVIRKSGALGGYRWGLERKMKMLREEGHLL